MTNKNNNYYLVGYSGHSFPIISAFSSNGGSFNGYFDKEEKKNDPYNLNFLGDENQFVFSKNDYVFIAIGDNLLRRKITSEIEKRVSLFSIIDSSAIIKSEINQPGIIVNARALIQPQCFIGKGVILNSGVIIEHECSIGNFAHIAPGAVLTGNVEIGENTLIGANATLLPGIKIGKNCIVGAGSVVTAHVPDNTIIKGNPGR